ncbi:nuclear transport factor 2 family protein [Cryptosporangium aurantiacum]|uniref:Ketosteroid isomerase-related protein n=1 Tax=Cryptosporangium aurantiacum TaxID=134849 RepID=A0A1M7PME7_9ACTN|nr:nuclear transport factor 2 family protein [Cryptosporangium aurantiacum]SHN18241.1 Ketosteroid isomerase-related protein [Cryptosporangium aurantiacum]
MDTWVTTYFDAWTSGDPHAVVACFDPEVEFEDMPTGHRAHGLDEARAFVERAYEKAPGARYVAVHSLTHQDEYVIEWVMEPMGLRGASVGTLRAGRILTNRDYWSAP